MAYQQQPGGIYPTAPPPQQYPAASYPQQMAQPPQQMAQPPQQMAQPPQQMGQYPQQMGQPMMYQQAPPQQMAPLPAGPQLPSGYKMQDLFKSGNILQLLPCNTGYPLVVKAGNLTGNGNFVNNDSRFKVVIPDKAGPDTIMLQNMNWVGLHVAIKSHKVQMGKADKYSHFRVHVQPDNYVVFESVNTPGEYVAIQSNGVPPDKVKDFTTSDKAVKFFVRAERQGHIYEPPIVTPFGRPSIANQLRDGCIIQLYVKPSNTFLSINSNGIIMSTNNGGDRHTFFELVDRGMGIVALNSSLYPGYRLRMSNFVLEGKGDATLIADWRLKENADGTVQFESVTCQGSYLGINVGGTLMLALSVFLVNVQKFGGAETITKTPLN